LSIMSIPKKTLKKYEGKSEAKPRRDSVGSVGAGRGAVWIKRV